MEEIKLKNGIRLEQLVGALQEIVLQSERVNVDYRFFGDSYDVSNGIPPSLAINLFLLKTVRIDLVYDKETYERDPTNGRKFPDDEDIDVVFVTKKDSYSGPSSPELFNQYNEDRNYIIDVLKEKLGQE
jgi:hypothetical protein